MAGFKGLSFTPQRKSQWEEMYDPDFTPIDDPDFTPIKSEFEEINLNEIAAQKKHRPIEEQPGFFGGITDFFTELGGIVNKTGKTAAEQVGKGDYRSAFHTLAAPVMDPFEGLIGMGVNKAEGQPAMQPMSKMDAAGQVAGAVGYPTEGFKEAWETSNYPRLAGQTLGAAASIVGPHAYKKFKFPTSLPEPKHSFPPHSYTRQPYLDLPGFSDEAGSMAGARQPVLGGLFPPGHGMPDPYLPYRESPYQPETGLGLSGAIEQTKPLAGQGKLDIEPIGGMPKEITMADMRPRAQTPTPAPTPRTVGFTEDALSDAGMENNQEYAANMLEGGYKFIGRTEDGLQSIWRHITRLASEDQGAVPLDEIRTALRRLFGREPSEQEVQQEAFKSGTGRGAMPPQGVADFDRGFIPEENQVHEFPPAPDSIGANLPGMQTHEFQPLMQYRFPEATHSMRSTSTADVVRAFPNATGDPILDQKIARMKQIVELPRTNNAIWQEFRELGYDVSRALGGEYRRGWNQSSSEPGSGTVPDLNRVEPSEMYISEVPPEQGQLLPMEMREPAPQDADLARVLAANEADLLARTPMRAPEQQSMAGELGDTIVSQGLRDQGIDPSGGGGGIIGKFLTDESGTFDPNAFSPNEMQQKVQEAKEWFRNFFKREPTGDEIDRYLWGAYRIKQPEQEMLPHPGGLDSLENVGRVIGGERYVGQLEQPEFVPGRERPFETIGGQSQSPLETGFITRDKLLRDVQEGDPNQLQRIYESNPEQQSFNEAFRKAKELERIQKNLATFQAAIDSGKKLSISQQRIYEMLQKFVADESGSFSAGDLWEGIRQKAGIGQGLGRSKKPKNPDEYSRFEEIMAFPSSVTTTGDLSPLGRQGLTLFNTPEFWYAAWKAGKSLHYDTWKKIDQEIRNNPLHQKSFNPTTGKWNQSQAERMGIKLFRPASEPGPRAEAVASRWLETGAFLGPDKILGLKNPVRGVYNKTLGRGIRATNRFYISFLNELMTNRGKYLMDRAEDMSLKAIRTGEGPMPGVLGGFNPRNTRRIGQYLPDVNIGLKRKYTWQEGEQLDPYRNDILAKDIGNFVKAAIGQATATNSLERAVEAIGPVLFSPGLLNSRIRFLNPTTYIMATPYVRKQYLKAAIGAGMGYMAFMTMAKLAAEATGTEHEIVTDFTNSDLGKFKIGNTRLDPGGGFLQFLVLLGRAYNGGWTSSSNPEEGMHRFGEGYQPETQLSNLLRFGSNKLNPVAKFAWDIASATENKPFHALDRTAQMFVPLFMQDMYELANTNPELLPWVVPVAFGVGTQTYGKYGSDYIEPKGGRFVAPENDWISKGGGFADLIPGTTRYEQ